jgi:transcriptional regulator with XRE-family HTH domain
MERRDVIGGKITECRGRFATTQAQLADLLGIERAELADFESGRRLASVGFLMDVTALARLTLGWLICEQASDSIPNQFPLDCMEGRVLAAFATMKDEPSRQFALRLSVTAFGDKHFRLKNTI